MGNKIFFVYYPWIWSSATSIERYVANDVGVLRLCRSEPPGENIIQDLRALLNGVGSSIFFSSPYNSSSGLQIEEIFFLRE
jgi:hypothetical protein